MWSWRKMLKKYFAVGVGFFFFFSNGLSFTAERRCASVLWPTSGSKLLHFIVRFEFLLTVQVKCRSTGVETPALETSFRLRVSTLKNGTRCYNSDNRKTSCSGQILNMCSRDGLFRIWLQFSPIGVVLDGPNPRSSLAVNQKATFPSLTSLLSLSLSLPAKVPTSSAWRRP